MEHIAILGSTGSIGVSSLRVIDAHPDKYTVHALAAGSNIDLLKDQIEHYRPRAVAIADEHLASRLRNDLNGYPEMKIFSGPASPIEVATLDKVDTVISAMTGAVGLLPTYYAVTAGKKVALANKEVMVMAGPLIMTQAQKRNTTIVPIDSEHSAVLQSLQGHPREDLKRIILTASGGPFRDLSLKEMVTITPDQALKHPNWSMGEKITIDSSTLMNKGLEVIEAKWLFDLHSDQISIVIHPESIVHSMVEYRDGSVIAQLGIPDMTTPISYALSYPRHLDTRLPPPDLANIGTLTFQEPDMDRFRCLALALKAAEIGGSMPAVLNGANEIAVDAFLKGMIGFLQIAVLIEKTLAVHQPVALESIEGALDADHWARERARHELAALQS